MAQCQGVGGGGLHDMDGTGCMLSQHENVYNESSLWALKSHHNK
jgi:hypothetical protein